MAARRSPPLRIVALLALLGFVTPVAGASAAPGSAEAADETRPQAGSWVWPVAPPHIVAHFVAPAHEYGPGHRGIDLRADAGEELVSPASGVIAFAGSVAGRGVVTIDHGSGLVTTLEPVRAVTAIGASVRAGDVVAVAEAGGHTPPGAVHFGVREDGDYINPLVLYGEVPRAVLLPCC